MTGVGQVVPVTTPAAGAGPTLALASRGDALTPFLFDALARRFPVAGRIDPELTARQRYHVAAMTFRHNRTRWIERFYKSSQAFRFRTVNASRQLDALSADFDVVFQVHALFDIPQVPSVLYVDCTHRQSVAGWPAWNPLSDSQLRAWYDREKDQYQRARHIFAFYEQTRQSLIKDYGVSPSDVTVTGAGVNLDRLPTIRPVGASNRTILFIGNDFHRKGGDVLLAAFRLVRRRFPDARLQLVGAGAEVSAEPGVEALGRIRDRDRIAELYRQASVFAMPSNFDPFPLVLLEAMAFGVPVVATRQSGVPDMIDGGTTGWLVPTGGVDELAAALTEALADPGRAAAFGAAGRTRAANYFTWDAVVDRMAPALQALGGHTS